MKFKFSRLLLVLGFSFACMVQAAVEDAKAGVDAFHSMLTEMMQMPEQGMRESYIREKVAMLFDVSRIAKISVGRSWLKLNDDQRRDFKGVLGELIVATYADRFDAYKGQAFRVVGVREVKKGIVVRSELLPRDGEPVKLDYFFRDGKVFNVAADGVSDLSLRRADYSRVMKDRGFDALISHLREKVEETRRQ